MSRNEFADPIAQSLLSRRGVLGGAAAGGAGLLLPDMAMAQRRRRGEQVILGGFTHGVATGEPGPTRMLFWTRYQGAGDQPVKLALEVATDPRMTKVRVMGETYADPARDWTARLSVEGLSPGQVYYYRWQGPEKNVKSIVGRTKTLPAGAVQSFRMGVFSCSNLPYGWFNAYAHAAAADDLDLFVHLGDYIYEYPVGTYPAAGAAVSGRRIEPAHELVTRADYWARYRSYRADPDLQRLHANGPSVTIWDDHDIANDAWSDGASGHQANEGVWAARKAAAMAAFRDWLPVSDAAWARYDIGTLASLYRLDTRLSGRDKPLVLADAIRQGPDSATAIKRFRDQDWVAGHRQMLGYPQEQWLFNEVQAAQRRGVRWQVLAQQVVMGSLRAPTGASQLSGGNAAGFWGAAEMSARVNLPFNMDAWDGYPAARARLLAQIQRTGSDLLVLSGDSHNAWGNELSHGGRPVGVEFATSSVTSPGLEMNLGRIAPDVAAGALVQANPGLKWADTSRRGYMHVTLTPQQAVCDWRFTDPVASRSERLAASVRARVLAGQKRLQMG